MENDTRTFESPEGKLVLNRTEIESVWQDEGSEWCEVSYVGRLRMVKADTEDILAWIRGG